MTEFHTTIEWVELPTPHYEVSCSCGQLIRRPAQVIDHVLLIGEAHLRWHALADAAAVREAVRLPE